jgi:alkanesulfonate monooxygenase SsuD/methylene tetrahydromethanopterin reductase-like flavin-dependent oxidoreductase (luciferase family)
MAVRVICAETDAEARRLAASFGLQSKPSGALAGLRDYDV